MEQYGAVATAILEQAGYNAGDSVTHTVVDSDGYFVIDPKTRKITSESQNKLIIQFDHESERISFKLPRYVEGHDMSACTNVEVHYNNISTSRQENAGIYDVTDLAVVSDEHEMVQFTWLISENATQYEGLLSFLIMFKCERNGEVEYRWSTFINSDDITVGKGMNNGSVIVTEYADILVQWEQRLFSAEDSAINNIEAKAEETMDTVTVHAINTLNEFNANVDKKASDTLASIPEDYTELDAEVKEQKKTLTTKANKTTVEELEDDISVLKTDVSTLENTKANKTDLTSPFNYKGSCLYSELPAEANINDTWYCTDLRYRVTWNGVEWAQSSMDESEYVDELNSVKSTRTSYLVNPSDWGIYTDGTHENETTDGINDVLQYCYDNNLSNIVFPKGVYLIKADREAKNYSWINPFDKRVNKQTGIQIRSNQHIDFCGSTIKGQTNNSFVAQLVGMFAIENSSIENCSIVGDLYSHITPCKICNWESGNIDDSGVFIEDVSAIRTSKFVDKLDDGSEIPSSFTLRRFLGINKNTPYNIYWFTEDDEFVSKQTIANFGSTKISKPANCVKFMLSVPTQEYDENIKYTVSIETDTTYPTREFNHGVQIKYSNNCVIKNALITQCVSDGLIIDDDRSAFSSNLLLDNVEISYCRRQAISFCGGANNTILRNCKFHDIEGTEPEAGIDFEHYCEQYKAGGFGSVYIEGCEFYDCYGGWINNFNGYGIYVDKCKFYGTKYASQSISSYEGHDIYFDNCEFKGRRVSLSTLGANSSVKNSIVKCDDFFEFSNCEILSNTIVECEKIKVQGISTKPCITGCTFLIKGNAEDNYVGGIRLLENTTINNDCDKIILQDIEFINNCNLDFAGFYKVKRVENSVINMRKCLGVKFSTTFKNCTFNIEELNNNFIIYDSEVIECYDCDFTIKNATSGYFAYNYKDNENVFSDCKIVFYALSGHTSLFEGLQKIKNCIVENKSSEFALKINTFFDVGNSYKRIYKGRHMIDGLQIVGNVNYTYNDSKSKIVSNNFLINNSPVQNGVGKNNGVAVQSGDVIQDIENNKSLLVKTSGILTKNEFVAGTTYSAENVFHYNGKCFMVSASKTIQDSSLLSASVNVGEEVSKGTGIYYVGVLATYSII